MVAHSIRVTFVRRNIARDGGERASVAGGIGGGKRSRPFMCGESLDQNTVRTKKKNPRQPSPGKVLKALYIHFCCLPLGNSPGLFFFSARLFFFFNGFSDGKRRRLFCPFRAGTLSSSSSPIARSLSTRALLARRLWRSRALVSRAYQFPENRSAPLPPLLCAASILCCFFFRMHTCGVNP